jgi:quinol-cytochrome oxidoreductase complex cytochrome b subunit
MADYSKGRSEEELEPFFPNEILRHTLLTFFFISAVMLGVLFFPESFQKSTDEFASFQTKPTWFLLPFIHFSTLINNKFYYIVILTIYAIMFIAVPFLDRNAERSLWKKPVFLSVVIINLLMILALGITKYFQ